MSSRYDNLLANVPTDLWIGGKWRKSSDGGRFDVLDPATEAKIASVASATVEDAKAAVDAASDAFEDWAGKKPRERAEVLRKSFELIMRDAERLAKLITIENGKALSDSRGEVAYAAEFFRWYAEEATRAIGAVSRAPASSRIGMSASMVSGVSDAGLSTTGQPAASAGPILRVAMAAGKFHGVTSTATPAGLCWTTMRAPEAGARDTAPTARVASSAYQRKNSAA